MIRPKFNVGQLVEVMYAEGEGAECECDGALARIMKRQHNRPVLDGYMDYEGWSYLVRFISDGSFGKCMEEWLRRHIEKCEEVQWEDLSSK